MKILVVIPARGGSKGIPRKNVRLMAGKPLISYSIETALKSKYVSDVVVTTDDEEIKRISLMYGAILVDRPSELATDIVTLDPVIYHATIEMEERYKVKYDAVITMQPTSPLLTVSTLDSAIDSFVKENFDTLISGVNRPHLAWTEIDGKCKPLYSERLNRQYLPKYLLETGAFFISKRQFVQKNNRFGPNLTVFEVPDKEAVDIDSVHDWWIAEKEITKRRILIRTDGYSKIGLGHIYRCLLLAYNLIDHEITFVLSSKSDIGADKIKKSHFSYEIIDSNEDILLLIKKYKCDLVINDILDTDQNYIGNLKKSGVRIVNFEDLGTGADYADAVINDLYEKQKEGVHYYWGSDYYCLRDEFLFASPKPFNEQVNNILVLFGGTDPCNLTKRLLNIITTLPKELNITYTFILGMGYEYMSEIQDVIASSSHKIEVIQNVNLMTDYIGKADIAISSQGRTMLELASMAVPTVLLAQNRRELHHEFGYLKNGFINLGLGSDVDDTTIRETIIWLINSPQIRNQMRNQMLSVDLKNGIQRVKKIILGDK